MRIEHLAIWVSDIERMKEFYTKYFKAAHNNKYINPEKGFESYFINFDSNSRLELMKSRNVVNKHNTENQFLGLAHLAISVGSKENVDELTGEIKNDGYCLIDGPRWTGDGYYESVILDPEGNRIEITI